MPDHLLGWLILFLVVEVAGFTFGEIAGVRRERRKQRQRPEMPRPVQYVPIFTWEQLEELEQAMAISVQAARDAEPRLEAGSIQVLLERLARREEVLHALRGRMGK